MKRRKRNHVNDTLLEFMQCDELIWVLSDWQDYYASVSSAVTTHNNSAKRLGLPVVARQWRGSVYLVKVEAIAGFSHIFL